MKELRFVIKGKPCGKGRPIFSRFTGRARTPEKTLTYEAIVRSEYERQCGDYKFDENAMLDLRVKAYYPIPKSISKKERERRLANLVRPTTKPDNDNILKAIEDALNEVAYKDDVQIVDCQIRKFYSEEPRVEIILREVITE